MSNRTQERFRSRARIGADAARAWLRDFNLRNPYAKAVLMAVANYMNEDGSAWPGLTTLSQDTDISEDTIASRLRWCESIGLIVVLKCWVDENGRRNYEKNGRPTSSEIRFRFDADVETVEAAARASKGEQPLRGAAAASHASRGADEDDEASLPSDSQDSGFCHRPRRGLADEALPPAGTQLAPDQPPPAAVRSLEPEQESIPPYPPSGGDGQRSIEQGGEATWPHAASWAKVETAWNDPILHQQTCREIWSVFTEIERERFPRVIRGYLAWRLAQPKIPNRCNLQKLMRERDAWPGYEKLAGPDPSLRTFVAENSAEHRALQVIASIGHWSAPSMQFDQQQGLRGIWRGRPLHPDELAMATFADKPLDQWTALERGTKPFYAWSERLYDWTGVRRDDIRVPLLFPPRKDGTIAPDTTGPPKPETE